MDKTMHSVIRCKQRGINETNVELILALGTRVHKPGGAYEYFVTKKDRERAVHFLKQCIQNLDKLVGKAIIVDNQGKKILTVYHKTR
jgi:hypothetical protein